MKNTKSSKVPKKNERNEYENIGGMYYPIFKRNMQ